MIRACPTGEIYATQQDNHLPNFTTTSRITHPFGVLSLKLCPIPSASLRNQTFLVTGRQRPAQGVHPAPQRPALRVSDSQEVRSPRRVAPGPLSCPPGCLRGAKPLPGPQPRGRKGARLGPRGAGWEQSKRGEQGKPRGSPGKGRGLETTQKHRIEEEGAI